MRIRVIRLGSFVTLYNGIYAVLCGLAAFIFRDTLLSEYFRRFPVTWELFGQSFPERAALYSRLFFISGFLTISFGVFIIYLSYFILKKRDKLAWVILFSAGILGWASLLIINILAQNWISVIIYSVGWLSFVIGMIIPIRYYITKEIPEF